MKHTIVTSLLPLLVLSLFFGCDEDEYRKLAEMAERHNLSQEEQRRLMVELQKEVANGSNDLVTADANAREAWVALHREVQQERTEIGQQRDRLEEDRKALAAQRQHDSLIAATMLTCSSVVVCTLPLVLCWYLLSRPQSTGDDTEIAEVFLNDVVASQPLLLPRQGPSSRNQIQKLDSPDANSPTETAD